MPVLHIKDNHRGLSLQDDGLIGFVGDDLRVVPPELYGSNYKDTGSPIESGMTGKKEKTKKRSWVLD